MSDEEEIRRADEMQQAAFLAAQGQGYGEVLEHDFHDDTIDLGLAPEE
jgi:hypothetical protein